MNTILGSIHYVELNGIRPFVITSQPTNQPITPFLSTTMLPDSTSPPVVVEEHSIDHIPCSTDNDENGVGTVDGAVVVDETAVVDAVGEENDTSCLNAVIEDVASDIIEDKEAVVERKEACVSLSPPPVAAAVSAEDVEVIDKEDGDDKERQDDSKEQENDQQKSEQANDDRQKQDDCVRKEETCTGSLKEGGNVPKRLTGQVSSVMDSRKAWGGEVIQKCDGPRIDSVIPYETLKAMRVEDGIDMTRKEEYLASDEFEQYFKQDIYSFKKLPMWRQIMLKKKVGLF